MAKRPAKASCPLCGRPVAAEGLDALGKHFETCPKTDRARRAQGAGEE